MTSVDKADAATLNSTERFLANNRLWFEYDYDQDLVCHLYDIRRGTPDTPVHLRIIDYPYPVNPFTGQCTFRTPLAPAFGGVGKVDPTTNALRIRFPSGAVQRIRIGDYVSSERALRISRSGWGPSWWLHCSSPYHPFC